MPGGRGERGVRVGLSSGFDPGAVAEYSEPGFGGNGTDGGMLAWWVLRRRQVRPGTLAEVRVWRGPASTTTRALRCSGLAGTALLPTPPWALPPAAP